jgi:hypothetical protein
MLQLGEPELVRHQRWCRPEMLLPITRRWISLIAPDGHPVDRPARAREHGHRVLSPRHQPLLSCIRSVVARVVMARAADRAMPGYQQRDRLESRSVLAVNLGGRGVGRALGCCAAALVCSMLLVGTAASSNAEVQTPGGATGASANKTAKVAVAILPDLGAGWAQYRKAGGVQKLAKSDCVYQATPTLTAP